MRAHPVLKSLLALIAERFFWPGCGATPTPAISFRENCPRMMTLFCQIDEDYRLSGQGDSTLAVFPNEKKLEGT